MKGKHAAASAAAAAASVDGEGGSIATTDEDDSRHTSPEPSCNGDTIAHLYQLPRERSTDSVETFETGESAGALGGVGGAGVGERRVRAARDYMSLPLSEACEALLGRPLLKDQQLSNWDQRPLSADQVRYASLDAHCLLAVLAAVARAEGAGRRGSAAPGGSGKEGLGEDVASAALAACEEARSLYPAATGAAEAAPEADAAAPAPAPSPAAAAAAAASSAGNAAAAGWLCRMVTTVGTHKPARAAGVKK